ncbi:MAG TPA: hypothetical protein VFV54_10630 [Thermoanaerobaculia bacterium]|nr:hypothetical protein [Thermoanaerobaculia bacterium]
MRSSSPFSVRRSPFAAALIFALCFTPAAFAQEEPAPEPEIVVSRAVVPAIGQIVGTAGVLWRSDVVLVNDNVEPVTVVVSPLPVPDAFQMRTLEPGESVLFSNAAADSFGIGSGVVPLLVQTLARRSVTVFATAYGLTEGRLTPTIIQPVLYGELPPSVQHLRGLAMTEGARTNIGVMNFGAQPAAVTLALQRLEGRPIASLTVIVPPEGSYHVPLNLLFPLVEGGDDFTLVVDSTGLRTFSYAVVLSNETHAGTFVMPIAFPR